MKDLSSVAEGKLYNKKLKINNSNKLTTLSNK
jgi:hypothetical protein